MYRGEACAAIELIEYAITCAKRRGDLTAEQIRAVRLILDAPEDELGCFPSPGEKVIGGDYERDRTWERTLHPFLRRGWHNDQRTGEALEMIYDITHPHDLRGVLNKPSITTEEVDAFIADADADPAVKLRLLEDVELQGYGPQGDA
jgi:hypothetical protein